MLEYWLKSLLLRKYLCQGSSPNFFLLYSFLFLVFLIFGWVSADGCGAITAIAARLANNIHDEEKKVTHLKENKLYCRKSKFQRVKLISVDNSGSDEIFVALLLFQMKVNLELSRLDLKLMFLWFYLRLQLLLHCFQRIKAMNLIGF